MADWFKKNIIFAIINALVLIILSIIGVNITSVVSAMDGKADKSEVEIQFKEAEKSRKALSKEDETQHKYIDDQNDKQDKERDKMDELVLKRLDYIILRVDKMSEH